MFEFDFGTDLPDLFAVRLSDAMENIIHVDNELATVWGGKEFLRALSSRRCYLFILKQTNGQQRQGLHRRLRAAAAAQLPFTVRLHGYWKDCDIYFGLRSDNVTIVKPDADDSSSPAPKRKRKS